MTRGNSRVNGYSGFYKGIYLRSSLEFAYAYYLDSKNINWAYEVNIYNLGNCQYKPDFFIYDNNKTLVKIVEVKGEGNSILGEEKLKLFKDYNDLEIQLITYKGILKLYQQEMPIRYHRAKEIWKKQYGASMINQSLIGQNNPMFGLKHKESTKKLIGEKARLRFENKEYRLNHIEKRKELLKDEEYIKKLSESAKARHNIQSTQKICPNCKKVFSVKLYSQNINKQYCSRKCSSIKSGLIGVTRIKQIKDQRMGKVVEYIHCWALENKDVILDAKFNNIKPTLKPMLEHIEQEYKVKDFRVLSEYIFGVDKGRKEMLTYLKGYVTENIC